MEEALFDLAAEYTEMLNQGLRLSGESQEFFVEGRLRNLIARLPSGFAPRRILDFGCGIGATSGPLAGLFPAAAVVGTDTSERALEYAAEKHGSARIRFKGIAALESEAPFDLCYSNGVFHHIHPAKRLSAVAKIHTALRPGGLFALFDNNPWNLGARMVMKRVPFDRHAIMMPLGEAKNLVKQAGFQAPPATWTMFYFPRVLAPLRFLERPLAALPLGAQYCVLARK